MRIGFVFFGIAHGDGSKSEKDFRHCWPGLKRDLIDPFVEKGHTAKVFVSTYEFTDKDIEKQFYDIVQPDAVHFSSFEGSDPFTCKGAALTAFEHNVFNLEDVDFIILTRLDLHYSKIMANENIDYTKFNFLYPEVGGHWWDILRFTTDNFYAWPANMTWHVKDALLATYRSLRPDQPDTHPLIHKLILRIGKDAFHFISNNPESSDVSSYYTLCRDGIPINSLMHPEVVKRFYLKGSSGPLPGLTHDE
jgi:hypothetical protein